MMKLVTTVAILASACASPCSKAAETWSETKWHGEDARVSEHGGWRAVVSLERARLVHFGPADTGENLLFAPATRDDPNGWGGHRVWLGPQAEWPVVWPPDPAWEASAAGSVKIDGARLELHLAPSAGDWARLTRVYAWRGDGLACTVGVSGGSRAAQVLQIFQVPATAAVRAVARPDHAASEGFVVLEIGRRDQVRRSFPWPAGVTRGEDNALMLRPAGAIVKLGFTPQPLRATIAGCELVLTEGENAGRTVGDVDDGFVTQVYLGRADLPFLELEQLSPRFAPGGQASTTIVLSARRRAPSAPVSVSSESM